MRSDIFFPSTREARLLKKVMENLTEVVTDTVDRYIETPVKAGHPERVIVGMPLAIINGTARAIDGVLAGIVGQPLRVPDGSFAETRRDLRLTGEHLVPPRPLKLATDIIRFPGTLISGLLDAAGGFDTRHGASRAQVL